MCRRCKRKQKKYGITYEPLLCWDYVTPVMWFKKKLRRILT